MQYFKDLPEIEYEGTDKDNIIELEVTGEVKRLPDDGSREIVFLGRMGRTAYLVIGKVADYEFVEAKEAALGAAFTRLKIDGDCIAFT